MTVRCGNNKVHDKDLAPHHHDTVAQVRLCFARTTMGGLWSLEEEADDAEQYANYLAERENDPDMAYERHLENLGHDEAELQERMEAQAGVIPFDVAMRASQPEGWVSASDYAAMDEDEREEVHARQAAAQNKEH